MPWRIIPQTIYDLLGRIVPGAFVFFIIFIVTRAPNLQEIPEIFSWAKENTTPAVAIFCLLATYVIGVILGQIYSVTMGKIFSSQDKVIVKKCMETCLSEHNRTLKALGYNSLEIGVEDLPRIFVMNDNLRLVAPTEIPRLLKVRAERRMSEVMLLGAATAVTFNSYIMLTQSSNYRLVLEVILMLMAYGMWRSARRRLKNVTNGTTVMWLMHATERPFPLPGSGKSEKSSNSLGSQSGVDSQSTTEQMSNP